MAVLANRQAIIENTLVTYFEKRYGKGWGEALPFLGTL
jgi:hypothetical protein